MSELYSHPDKTLAQHLQEVAEATTIIAAHHKLDATTERRREELVRLHDFGKATTFFQDYITYKPDPGKWPGERENKQHTLIGLFASAIIKEKLNLSHDWLLQIGTSTLGHHTQLPTRKDIVSKLEDDQRILLKQLENLRFQELLPLIRFAIEAHDLPANKNVIYKAADSYEFLFDWLDKLPLEKAIIERLKTQQLFSVLLESDKAFLALSEEAREHYRQRQFKPLSATLVETHLAKLPDSPINQLRQEARLNALQLLKQHSERGIYTLTLPTGVGKTLTALSLALELRQTQKKVIVVLPFLSIVDQTSKVYSEVLKSNGQEQPHEDLLIQSHSLSSRDYKDLEDADADFFLDTWQSDVVITTFDQVLLALFSSRAKHQMRFHHLSDAVIILDEIQALPTQLWDAVGRTLESLCKNFNSQVIAMSATQPGFVSGQELVPNLQDIFGKFGRYQLVFHHKQERSINEFSELLLSRKEESLQKRTLITLNTRKSARRLYDELVCWQSEDFPVYFLSADVTPKDRLSIINKIKTNYPKPCLVISTQVVEAGVDIDMDLVMRDFAPLDSIIQVAGRCNRNNRKPRCDVEVYSLKDEKGKNYSQLIYRSGSAPDVSLQETRRVLEKYEFVKEEEILELCQTYFAALRTKKNLGEKHTKNWAYFIEHLDVSLLLRGDQSAQHQFVIAERDEVVPTLEDEVRRILDIEDRWEKRRAFKRLAPRLAQVTVNVWAQRGFEPSSIAHQVGNLWFVNSGIYHPQRGLDVNDANFY